MRLWLEIICGMTHDLVSLVASYVQGPYRNESMNEYLLVVWEQLA